MDFANERYVRLYTRDTMGWKKLRWEGRLVWMELYRKADRSGVVSLGGDEPWEAAVLLCDIPEEIAQVGMRRCLEREWIVQDGDRLVFPEYIEANETPQSDKQRSKEYRERRAVTKRDEPITKRDEVVTPRHEPSHGVTSRHSVPSRAVLNRTVPNQPPNPPEGGGGGFDSNDLTRLFSALRAQKGGGKFSLQRSDYDRAQSAIAWAHEESADDPRGACERSIRKFLEHATGKEGDGWPFWAWANDPGKWLAYTPPKQVVKVVNGSARYAGPSEVAKAEEYAVNGDIKW